MGTVTTTDASVSPGDTGPGILSTQGNVTFDAQSSFVASLNGSNPGASSLLPAKCDRDRQPGGELSLIRSLGFTPRDGESFTIIKSTAPIVGKFNGLAEGASFTINGVPFTITYVGGGGDDVVLTQATTLTATTTTVVWSREPLDRGATGDLHRDRRSDLGNGQSNGRRTFTVDGTPETPVPLQVVGGHDQASCPISTRRRSTHRIRGLQR